MLWYSNWSCCDTHTYIRVPFWDLTTLIPIQLLTSMRSVRQQMVAEVLGWKTKVGTKDLNTCFCKEDIQMAIRYLRSCWTWELQWDTVLHMFEGLLQSANYKCWWGCRESQTIVHFWEGKMHNHHGRWLGIPQKIKIAGSVAIHFHVNIQKNFGENLEEGLALPYWLQHYSQ